MSPRINNEDKIVAKVTLFSCKHACARQKNIPAPQKTFCGANFFGEKGQKVRAKSGEAFRVPNENDFVSQVLTVRIYNL